MDRLLPKAAIAAMFTALLLVGIVSMPAFEADKGILDGKSTHAFETALTQKLPFREAAINVTAAIDYFVFGHGRPGVVVGTDGWLFTSEEFARAADPDANIAARADFVADVNARLEARGQSLVVLVVPDKSRIYEVRLGRTARPAALNPRYMQFLTSLAERGVEAPNLAARFTDAASSTQLFFRTDTHWTPDGAALAAELAGPALRKHLAGLDSVAFTTNPAEAEPLDGDLLRYIDLGSLAQWGPAPETIRPPITTEATDDLDVDALFADTVVPIVLVGTSFSADRRWNFAGALEAATGQRVENRAQIGKGPIIPMNDYLEATRDTANLPPVVLWEMPERSLGAQ